VTREELLLLIVELARSYVNNVKEEKPNRSILIDKMNAWIKAPIGSPYCITGLLWMLDGITRTHGVRFNLYQTASTQAFWKNTPERLKHVSPQPGDIAIWKLVGTPFGHAGLVTGILDEEFFTTVEFNTRNQASVSREGDNCYDRRRSMRTEKLFKLLGFVRVIDAALI
jgi:hypothetical protein